MDNTEFIAENLYTIHIPYKRISRENYVYLGITIRGKNNQLIKHFKTRYIFDLLRLKIWLRVHHVDVIWCTEMYTKYSQWYRKFTKIGRIIDKYEQRNSNNNAGTAKTN